MRLENDKVFNELYEDEFRKIPFIFRFGKTRIKVVIAATVILTVAALFLWSLFYSTGQSTSTPVAGAYEAHYVEYDYAYLIAMILVGLVVVLLLAWMVISIYFERQAFKKASNLANMIYLSERHNNEIRRQNERILNRDF